MSDWVSTRLRELIGRPISGSRPAGGVNTETEGVPSLGGENVLAEGGVTFENLNRVSHSFYKAMPKGRLQPFDVLINKDGAQTGKVGIYKGDFPDACVNEHLFILRNQNVLNDQRFLFYSVLLPETQSKIARRITGSAQPGLNTTFVDAVDILIPPNPTEQRRIAEILSTLDEAIEQTETLIAKHQQIKAGLMQDLFTRGVTPDGHLRPTREQAPDLYKESPLGWIPKEWDTATTGELCTSIVPGRNKPALDGGMFPWITITELNGTRVAESRAGLSLSASALKIAAGRTVPARSVIMSCVGEFGIAAIAGCELVINQQLHGFVASQQIYPEWLMHSLRLQRSFMERIATQTTIKYMNKAGCESIPVAVPPIEEQQVIVGRIESIENIGNSESQIALKLRSQKHGLMHDLLTGRVRVPMTEQ